MEATEWKILELFRERLQIALHDALIQRTIFISKPPPPPPTLLSAYLPTQKGLIYVHTISNSFSKLFSADVFSAQLQNFDFQIYLFSPSIDWPRRKSNPRLIIPATPREYPVIIHEYKFRTMWCAYYPNGEQGDLSSMCVSAAYVHVNFLNDDSQVQVLLMVWNERVGSENGREDESQRICCSWCEKLWEAVEFWIRWSIFRRLNGVGEPGRHRPHRRYDGPWVFFLFNGLPWACNSALTQSIYLKKFCTEFSPLGVKR